MKKMGSYNNYEITAESIMHKYNNPKETKLIASIEGKKEV
jgi:hypothetical protein